MNKRELFKNSIYTREQVKKIIDETAPLHIRHDSELGWVLKDGWFTDGINESVSTYRYMESGARRVINYADKECRINTYGDSYTQGSQVSDGETWQEFLAAHLGEPIRNFGVGSYSVYQSYLRMLREESKVPAKYIIQCIWDDDHFRNLDAWQPIRLNFFMPHFLFCTGPYLKPDVDTGSFEEMKNSCPAKEDLYNLCDLDWVYDTFKDNLVLDIMLTHRNAKEINTQKVSEDMIKLATTYGIYTDENRMETMDSAARELHVNTALKASMYVVDKTEEFAQKHGKQVIYVTCPGGHNLVKTINEGTRFDQPFVDFLKNREVIHIDVLDAYLADYASFKISANDYIKRYFIGHHNPFGNLFMAHSLIENLVREMHPKPIAYPEAKDKPGVIIH